MKLVCHGFYCATKMCYWRLECQKQNSSQHSFTFKFILQKKTSFYTHISQKPNSVSLIWRCKWNIMHAVLHFSQIPSCTSNTHLNSIFFAGKALACSTVHFCIENGFHLFWINFSSSFTNMPLHETELSLRKKKTIILRKEVKRVVDNFLQTI